MLDQIIIKLKNHKRIKARTGSKIRSSATTKTTLRSSPAAISRTSREKQFTSSSCHLYEGIKDLPINEKLIHALKIIRHI